jgi:hypothetical protein
MSFLYKTSSPDFLITTLTEIWSKADDTLFDFKKTSRWTMQQKKGLRHVGLDKMS